MVLPIKISTDPKEIEKIVPNLFKRIDNKIEQFTFDSGQIIVRFLQRQFIMQRKRAARTPLARRMRARKRSRFKYEIFMPIQAYYLDTMKPHYVSLKRGRSITAWARKYYTPTSKFRRQGRSRVFRGPRGGIKGGWLFVNPDPFVDLALEKAMKVIRNRLVNLLKELPKGG